MNRTLCWQRKTTHSNPPSFERVVRRTNAGSPHKNKNLPDSHSTSKLICCQSSNHPCCWQAVQCAKTTSKKRKITSTQTSFYSTRSATSNRKSMRSPNKSCVQPVFTKTCMQRVCNESKRLRWSINNEKLKNLKTSWKSARLSRRWDQTNRWARRVVRSTSASRTGKTLWTRK